MAMEKRVAIYIRVSTLDQAREGYSLDAQEQSLKKWCESRGYAIYRIYADRGISGKDFVHRPAMLQLFEDAEKKEFDVVLFLALSRFSRSVSDLYASLEKFERLGIDMISYTEPIDTSSPMGRAMIGIGGIFAQLERELTAERVRLALEERAAQGKRTCTEILGYDPVGSDTFIINEKEAEYVRFCFNEYLNRKNLSEVAAEAARRGYHGKRGRVPCAWSVHLILTRPQYCGYNPYCGSLYKGNYEAIISPEIFNAVSDLLDKQGKAIGRKPKRTRIRIIIESEEKT